MRHPLYFNSILLLIPLFLFAGCTHSDAQQEFENSALMPPSDITRMTDAGEKVPDAEDPDDWRISPLYRGLVEIATPAYPNPVNLNSPLIIEIENKGFETLNGLEVYVFEENFRDQILIYASDGSSIQPGLITIQLNPSQFGGNQSSGLFRLLIYDARQNILSYGDVEVL